MEHSFNHWLTNSPSEEGNLGQTVTYLKKREREKEDSPKGLSWQPALSLLLPESFAMLRMSPAMGALSLKGTGVVQEAGLCTHSSGCQPAFPSASAGRCYFHQSGGMPMLLTSNQRPLCRRQVSRYTPCSLHHVQTFRAAPRHDRLDLGV